MKDYYATLGVAKSASADEIKRAYRRLASQHHPDKGGDTARFQDIEEAYRVLGDPAARQQYDNPQPQFGSPFGAQGFNFNDIFSMFAQGGFPQQHARRNHLRMTVWITLRDAAVGGTRTLSIGTAQGTTNAQIDIPIGISDGDNVQYAGLGPGGTDLVVEFRLRPDPEWERQELNLITNLRVSVFDLICGSDIQITDIYGKELATSIPPNTQPGTMLRLRGRGLRDRHGHQGDAFVRVQAVLPSAIDPEIIAVIEKHRR
jgi:DnaJ-class molecular chaperone